MNKFTFIVGGARSGKSGLAVEIAKKTGKKTAFIATAEALDSEMKDRILKHKQTRPKEWKLIEEPIDIDIILQKIDGKYEVILIDCMALLVSNLLCRNLSDKKIETKLNQIIKSIKKNKSNIIMVSNDVGSGVVPDNPLARRFRDLVGFANQKAAKKADDVYFMQCGLYIKMK